MFNSINDLSTSAFGVLDDFGRDHWGFMVSIVFIWWALDRVSGGIRKDIRTLVRMKDSERWQRLRQPRQAVRVFTHVPRRATLVPRGFGAAVRETTTPRQKSSGLSGDPSDEDY